MIEAKFQKIIDEEKKLLQCFLCSHRCRIKIGKRGICGVRENREGKLYSLVYGRIVSENVDPIEKKPIFHMLPASLSYSISTVGCNFRCQHCQNYGISQYPHQHKGEITGSHRTPEQVVEAALERRCKSISYTYVEPTIFYEFAYDTAKLAHQKGIKNVFVSNGYTTPEAVSEIAPYLDANNIDLKAFSDKFYREVCGAKLAPVLDTITQMKELGVWVEVTTLVIPGWNDTDKELQSIAEFIKGIDPQIPWHVTAFYPTYKMIDRGATPVSTLRRAREIGKAAGLHYVYVGNVPGEGGENTFCKRCSKEIINRTGFSISSVHMDGNRCGYCKEPVAGIF